MEWNWVFHEMLEFGVQKLCSLFFMGGFAKPLCFINRLKSLDDGLMA